MKRMKNSITFSRNTHYIWLHIASVFSFFNFYFNTAKSIY